MKKIVYLLIATLLVTNFLSFTPSAEISDEQFTHTVFAEEFTATWCVYCPSAAENLMLIYENVPGEPYYDDNFFFVALITDVNDKADDRMGDFPDVTGYPTVIFDGNDEKVSGGQSSTANYEQAIDTTGQRDDTDISLEIEMNHLGNDKLDISIGMTWNEDGSFGNPTFNGYVRAYIVEKISRYNNYDGDPYHFGFLDYAFDQTVELEPREKQSLSAIWTGGDHQDKNGDGHRGECHEAAAASQREDDNHKQDRQPHQWRPPIKVGIEVGVGCRLEPENDRVAGTEVRDAALELGVDFRQDDERALLWPAGEDRRDLATLLRVLD